ncbi:MAG: hypothetical protein ABW000_05080, partial [Actinoplanes sp.]
IHIYTQLYDDEALADLRRMVEEDNDPVREDVDALPPDADEATRQNLADKLAPVLAQNLLDYPWLSDPTAHVSKSANVTRQTFLEAVNELYNAAQLDVLRRAALLAHEQISLTRENAGDD